MNDTTVNTTNTLPSCGFAILPLNVTTLSSEVYVAFTIRVAVNAVSCPFVILLNILVMVAVKTKRQLRTKSNIALVCLATTDLVIGLVVQPLDISTNLLLLKGETEVLKLCNLVKILNIFSTKCVTASLLHLFLMSAERYLAIKHPFAYENQVTEIRFIIASGVVWTAAIILPMEEIPTNREHFVTILTVSFTLFVFFPFMVYFNIAVYKEVRRNERHIAANQVSLEAKEKLIKNKKAFYTTVICIIRHFSVLYPAKYIFSYSKLLQGSYLCQWKPSSFSSYYVIANYEFVV